MSSFRIDELHPEIARVVREQNVDTGPQGAADGVITEADGASIDRAITALERSATTQARNDAALLRQLRPATSNGLAMPRPADAGQRVRGAIDSRPRPGDQIQALSTADLRVATIDERVAMIGHIVHGTGYGGMFGWWSGRVNNPREQRILEIINTTPEHQRGALVAALHQSPALLRDMQSAIDGAESTQFRAFSLQNIYDIQNPTDLANAIHQLGIQNEAELLTVAAQLRQRRGDRVADQVLTQLVGQQSIRNLMPYVWWTAPSYDCEDVADLAGRAAWQAGLEAQRRLHEASFENLLRSFPPGQAATMLRAEFNQRHDIQRIVGGIDLAACALQAITKSLSEGERAPQRVTPRSGTGL